MRLIDADSIPWDVEGVGEIPVVTKEEIDEMPVVDAIPIGYIEEMGDAENMLSQMRRILKIDLNEIEAVIRQKEERTIEIIGRRNGGQNKTDG